MKILVKLSLILLGFLSLNLFSADNSAFQIDEIEATEQTKIVFDTSVKNNEIWNQAFGQRWVRNVNQAALYRFLPTEEQHNGKAVIIVPGGGYLFVSIDNEGFGVARKLAAEGYTAFVLKYRTKQTPIETSGFKAQLAESFGNLGKRKLEPYTAAVDDLAFAVNLVNSRQKELAVNELSIIGFSAGARTAINLFETRPAANKLKGVALIYPPIEHQLTDTGPRPPLFFAIATDDPLFNAGNLNFVQKWLRSNPHADIHFYTNGGHGFGIKPKGTTSDTWWVNYLTWLQFVH